jgi:hypothetical protein
MKKEDTNASKELSEFYGGLKGLLNLKSHSKLNYYTERLSDLMDNPEMSSGEFVEIVDEILSDEKLVKYLKKRGALEDVQRMREYVLAGEGNMGSVIKAAMKTINPDFNMRFMEGKKITSKLGNIVNEATSKINRRTLLESEKKSLQEEFKTILKEFGGPTIDVDGITDSLASYYTKSPDLKSIDDKVYLLSKKTLSSHGTEVEVKRNFYITLADKIMQLADSTEDEGTKRELMTYSKGYNSIARSGLDNAGLNESNEFSGGNVNGDTRIPKESKFVKASLYDGTTLLKQVKFNKGGGSLDKYLLEIQKIIFQKYINVGPPEFFKKWFEGGKYTVLEYGNTTVESAYRHIEGGGWTKREDYDFSKMEY